MALGVLPQYASEIKKKRDQSTDQVTFKAMLAVIGAHLLAWPAGYVFLFCLQSPYDTVWAFAGTLLGYFFAGAVAGTIFVLWVFGLFAALAMIIGWVAGMKFS